MSLTVEDAAVEASFGRTTAYRYFPNGRSLLAAINPQIEMDSLLGQDTPEDPLRRLEIVAEGLSRQRLEYEPELRAQLQFALEVGPAGAESWVTSSVCRTLPTAGPGSSASRNEVGHCCG